MFMRAVSVLMVMGCFLFLRDTNSRVLLAQNEEPVIVPKPSTTTTNSGVGRTDPAKFINPPGWTWLTLPRELRTGFMWGPVGSNGNLLSGNSHIDAHDGSLRIYFVQSGPKETLCLPEYRLVILDVSGRRYLPSLVDCGGAWSVKGGSATHLDHAVYKLDRLTLEPTKATHIGVEQIVRKQK